MKRLFSSGVGIVAFYVAVCGAILLLQALPVTGIVLLILAGVFWIGVVVHVLMLHLTMAAAVRKISLVWLAVPIGYYGGGFLLHKESVRRAEAIAAEIERANAAAVVKADEPFTYLFRDSPEEELFMRYRVARAYIKGADNTFTRYEIGRDAVCDAANKGWSYDLRHEPYLRRADLFPRYRGPGKMRRCVITQDVPSGNWQYRLERGTTHAEGWLNSQTGVRWTIHDERTGAAVTAGEWATITALPAIVTLATVCNVLGSGPIWGCAASLWPTDQPVTAGYKSSSPASGMKPMTPSDDVDDVPISALGRVLSLQPRQPTD